MRRHEVASQAIRFPLHYFVDAGRKVTAQLQPPLQARLRAGLAGRQPKRPSRGPRPQELCPYGTPVRGLSQAPQAPVVAQFGCVAPIGGAGLRPAASTSPRRSLTKAAISEKERRRRRRRCRPDARATNTLTDPLLRNLSASRRRPSWGTPRTRRCRFERATVLPAPFDRKQDSGTPSAPAIVFARRVRGEN